MSGLERRTFPASLEVRGTFPPDAPALTPQAIAARRAFRRQRRDVRSTATKRIALDLRAARWGRQDREAERRASAQGRRTTEPTEALYRVPNAAENLARMATSAERERLQILRDRWTLEERDARRRSQRPAPTDMTASLTFRS